MTAATALQRAEPLSTRVHNHRPLRHYHGAHAGGVGLLLGKGPSLEAFLRDPTLARLAAGEPFAAIGAINEVATLLPRVVSGLHLLRQFDPTPPALYAFANDPINRWVQDLPGELACSFFPARLLHDATLRPVAPPGDVCLFYDHHGVDPLLHDPAADRHECTLAIGPWTAASAFQVMRLMGLRRLVVVGLDGQGGYARTWSGPFHPHYIQDHRYARLRCEEMGRAWQWDVHWATSGPTPA